MYVPPTVLVDPPQAIAWWQRLALAVLKQALDDARSYPVKTARPLAAGWLLSTTSAECRWWCAVAGIDPHIFRAHVLRELPADPLRVGT